MRKQYVISRSQELSGFGGFGFSVTIQSFSINRDLSGRGTNLSVSLRLTAPLKGEPRELPFFLAPLPGELSAKLTERSFSRYSHKFQFVGIY